MENPILLKNCHLYNSAANELVDILIEEKRISRIETTTSSNRSARQIDCDGRTVIPGLIDVHIQGAGGTDVLDGSFEALQTMSQTMARFGVTGFLATTLYNINGENKHLQLAAECTGQDLGGARLLGIHIEGPFINPTKRGMIPLKCITQSSKQIIDDIWRLCGSSLKMMTIAPELEGNLEIIKLLRQNGCVASFGHSYATYEQTKMGFDAGLNHVTHLYNAMTSINHREPGPLLAIFEHPSATTQIIADGVHVHPGMVNLAYRIMGAERCICITDGMQAIGMPEGRYVFHGLEYESKNGTARYLDGTLIGTAMGLNQIVSNFRKFTSASISDTVHTASVNPAILLGIDEKVGTLAENKAADLVVLDSESVVWMTMVDGKIVYEE